MLKEPLVKIVDNVVYVQIEAVAPEPIEHITVDFYINSTKDTQKIFSEKDCYLTNACAECPYLEGFYDSSSLPCNPPVPGISLKNEETGKEILITAATKDINFTSYPVIVCEPPPQSIQFLKDI